MTDLLSAFITYAASGPQEFCIAMVVPGLCVMMFGKKIEAPKPVPKSKAKRAKRKATKPAKTARKQPKAMRPKKQGETPKWKPFMKAEEYSAESLRNIEKYQNGRWKGSNPETDDWQTVGGRIPL